MRPPIAATPICIYELVAFYMLMHWTYTIHTEHLVISDQQYRVSASKSPTVQKSKSIICQLHR
jgi:hypothetical protein